MAFCTKCGNQVDDKVKFCPNCGNMMEVPTPAPAPIVEPVATPVAEPVVTPIPEPVAAPVVEPVVAPVVEAVEEVVEEVVAAVPPVAGQYQQAPGQPQNAYSQAYNNMAAGMQQAGFQQPQIQKNPKEGFADPVDVQQNKVMAILSYFGFLVLIPVFAAKNSRYARYHANQGLVLFIIKILYSVLTTVLNGFLPAAVLVVIGIVTLVVQILFFVFAIMGIVRAAKGQMKPLPLIGGIRILK